MKKEHAAPTGRDALIFLSEAYGGAEVLREAAKRLGRVPGAGAALSRLRKIAGAATRGGGRVNFDLGMVNDLSYYTGVVFEGVIDGIGYPVLRGGRYDGLLARFGRDLPAAGFALVLDDL